MIRRIAAILALASYLVVVSGVPGIAHRLSAAATCSLAGQCAAEPPCLQLSGSGPRPADHERSPGHDADFCAVCFQLAVVKSAVAEAASPAPLVEAICEYTHDLSAGRTLPALSDDLIVPRAPPSAHI